MTDRTSISSLRALLGQRSRGLREEDFQKADPYLRQALSENKYEGLRMAVTARWIALAISAVLAVTLNPVKEALFYLGIILIFALLGWAQLRVAQVARSRAEVLLIICDIGLLAFAFVAPNPFREEVWPSAFQFHLTEFGYFYVLLALGTLAYSWRTITAFCIFTTVFWALAIVWSVQFGLTVPELSENAARAFAGYDRIAATFDPNALQIEIRIQEIAVFLIVAGILLLNGRRSHELTLRQAGIARERANLSRHFPPNIVDQMADQDEPLGAVRSQDVASMFVDIVGFSRIAETVPPQDVVVMLREFHGLLERKVFEFHGTLDKFLGDGLMATFGTPQSRRTDACNAAQCARAMLREVDLWNKQRIGRGQDAVKVSIGLHFGPVIIGDIGTERRLEYAVLGDTVNVASRLEALTRHRDVRMLVSDDLVRAVTAADTGAAGQTALQGLVPIGPQTLRGRDQPVEVWALR